MAVYEFSGVTVRDAQGLPAAGATGTLYDKDDASFSTPLTVTDLNGLPLVLTADQFGQLPDFQINHDEPRAVWKPSDPSMATTPLLSMDGVVKAADDAAAAALAAQAAQLAAEASQSMAASLAAGVVRTVNGVAPDGSGNVVISGGGGAGSAVTSVAGKVGDVSLVKADVGLGQVDNTSDANKPVSTAQAAALAGKANTGHTHAVADTTGLQAALDSKAGLNAAVNASQINAGTGVIAPARLGTGTSIATKFLRGDGTWQTVSTGGGGTGAVNSVNGQTGDVVLDAAGVGALPDTYTAPVTSVAGLTGAVVLNKTNVGLANVDNTADSAKPVSALQQAALDAKAADSAVVKLTGNQTVAGTKTFSAAPVVPDGSFTQAKVSGLVSALAGKVGSSTVTDIVVLTAAAYNALPTPRSSSTLYIKVG